ncbi:hypothetical protein FQZ97_855810 [compost metagenome]
MNILALVIYGSLHAPERLGGVRIQALLEAFHKCRQALVIQLFKVVNVILPAVNTVQPVISHQRPTGLEAGNHAGDSANQPPFTVAHRALGFTQVFALLILQRIYPFQVIQN